MAMKITKRAKQEASRLLELYDSYMSRAPGFSKIDWKGAAFETGRRLGRTQNWEDLKSLLTFLRNVEGEEVAEQVQRGAKAGADESRAGDRRDPSKKARKSIIVMIGRTHIDVLLQTGTKARRILKGFDLGGTGSNRKATFYRAMNYAMNARKKHGASVYVTKAGSKTLHKVA